jgi:Flp pilus assembly protein TadG
MQEARRETMRKKYIQNAWKGEKGQSLVEFALVVPLLLLLVIGIAEFGRAWMAKNILTGAAREAVRMAAVPPPTGMDNNDWLLAINARAENILNSAGIVADNIAIVVNVVANDPVSVTVSYNFPVVIAGFIPGLDNATIPLSSTTTMRREY